MIILDDLLILLLALAVAGMVLAPLESLHWWATRGAEEVETIEEPTSVESTAAAVADARPRRFLVYLSGIGALAAKDVPEENSRPKYPTKVTTIPRRGAPMDIEIAAVSAEKASVSDSNM